MVPSVTPLLSLSQPEATNMVAPSGAGGGGSAAPPPAPSPLFTYGTLVVVFVMMYFLMIRPQQKRQKEIDALLKGLKKGDEVRTSGGIRGKIVDLNEADVTLLIADKVKINVLRSHVSSKIDKPSAESKGKDS